MAAERRPGSNRGRAGIDWDAAFLHYAALQPEQRDYASVATEFGVSARTVERHGREERWRERARELDREAARCAAARLVEKRAETSGDFLRLIEATLIGYAQDLRAGKVRLSAADLPRLHKLLRELWEPVELQFPEQSSPPPGEPPDSLEHKHAVLRALQEVLLPEEEREHEQLDGGDGERDQGGGRDEGAEHGEEGGGR